MRKLKQGKKAEPLAGTVCQLLFPYRGEAVKTITTDNESEFACHEKITRKTGGNCILCLYLCFMAERSRREYKQIDQAIYPPRR